MRMPQARTAGMWAPYRELKSGFWIFFSAALLYEAGFGLYFFLFNLYLLDLHFNEKAIGLISGALSLGLLTTTLPVGILSRKIGNQRLLLFCFIVAPLLGVLRALWMREAAQIALAFAAGLVMSIWTVCFLPVSASLTSERNRASAIGLIFSVGIGATALGSAACGYLSHSIAILDPAFTPAQVKRVVLLLSCGVSALGSIPLLRLPTRVPAPHSGTAVRLWSPALLRDSFLRRYLPCMALWTSLVAAFTPFASIYFEQQRHIALTQVGLLFSVSQMAQLAAGLLIPVIISRLTMMRSILVTQLSTALLLVTMVAAGPPAWVFAAFILYSATQWMSSTACYTLLMNRVPEPDRSAASAMTMFCSSLAGAGATSAAGLLLVRFHYAPVLLAMALVEAVVAILFQILLRHHRPRVAMAAGLIAESVTE